jgi:predicted PurR-regulated permease PerM
MDSYERADSRLSARAKLTILIVAAVLAAIFLLQIRSILSPFLWALVAAYVLSPIVNYLNIRGGLPRLWAVMLIYLSVGILVLTTSRYLYPRAVEQGNIFLEDLPHLVASLQKVFGPRPFGIDIDSLVRQLLSTAGVLTGNSTSAGHLLVNALETFVKLFLFLVTTFYLLVDGPRLKATARRVIPPTHRDELLALAQLINVTWQQYIRGELVLFVIMATATSIGLTILQVPGAIFIGLASGALELLPLVGPITAGAIAVSVAYFSQSIPWGWNQVAYAGVVALMYFVLRQAEDYFVVPHVLGRAVRLHPLVVIFAVATGGVAAGLFGLVIAVPVAASLKEIGAYLYAKLLDLPVEFQPVRTLGGGVIEIPIRGKASHTSETAAPEGTHSN